MKINIPTCGKIEIDLDNTTPVVLKCLCAGFAAALANSTDENETGQLENALSIIEKALLMHGLSDA